MKGGDEKDLIFDLSTQLRPDSNTEAFLSNLSQYSSDQMNSPEMKCAVIITVRNYQTPESIPYLSDSSEDNERELDAQVFAPLNCQSLFFWNARRLEGLKVTAHSH